MTTTSAFNPEEANRLNTTSRLARFTAVMVRRRRWVFAFWTVAFVASMWAAAGLSDLLTNRFEIPGSEAQAVEVLLEESFGQRSDGVFMIVARTDQGNVASLLPQLAAAADRASRQLPNSEVLDIAPLADDVAVGRLVTTLDQADSKQHVDAVRKAIGDLEGADEWLTGGGAFAHDLDPVLQEGLQKGEFFFAMPIALVILALVFGTLGFVLPFMFAGLSIPITLGVVWVFAHPLDLSTYILNLVVGIGLGISIDYSLLIYNRYQEELTEAQAETTDQDALRLSAVLRTQQTAGRTVIVSGTAVALGLAVLLLMPLPFMQGFGVAGLIIPLVSMALGLTMMPALMYSLGHRLERRRFLPKRFVENRHHVEGSWWQGFSRGVMRWRYPVFIASASLLIAMAWPLQNIEFTPGTNEGIPTDVESVAGVNVVNETLGAGGAQPTEIVIDTGAAGAATSPQTIAAVQRLAEIIGDDDEVVRVTSAPGPGMVDETERYLRISATNNEEFGSLATRDFVKRVRDQYISDAQIPDGVSVSVGGGPGTGVDLIDTAYGTFPYLVALVLVLAYILLTRAFRSLFLPFKAIVLNLLSIGASVGLMWTVFSSEIGDAIGLTTFPAVEFWIPIFLFAMIFGLSMDYEVFIVNRMREEWDASGDNAHAVSMGLARTGRIVTAAGIIMAAAFAGFMAVSPVGFQQFGFGLTTAILIDVTIVRMLLLPSTMAIMGRWNWWLPEWAARIVRVPPSPLEPAQTPAPQ